jgi:hypothetical protein
MSLSLSAQRTLTLVCMDVLIVAELTYAFLRCANTTADFSETFLACYVPLFVPTIVVSFILLRRIKRREAALLDAVAGPSAACE